MGGASSSPAPSFLPPLLSLLGQKLGPRGGSSCRLRSNTEALLGLETLTHPLSRLGSAYPLAA